MNRCFQGAIYIIDDNIILCTFLYVHLLSNSGNMMNLSASYNAAIWFAV